MDVEIDPTDFVSGNVDLAIQDMEGVSLRLLDFFLLCGRDQLEPCRTLKLGVEGTFGGSGRTPEGMPRFRVVLSYTQTRAKRHSEDDGSGGSEEAEGPHNVLKSNGLANRFHRRPERSHCFGLSLFRQSSLRQNARAQ
jgi:hypothetical protein